MDFIFQKQALALSVFLIASSFAHAEHLPKDSKSACDRALSASHQQDRLVAMQRLNSFAGELQHFSQSPSSQFTDLQLLNYQPLQNFSQFLFRFWSRSLSNSEQSSTRPSNEVIALIKADLSVLWEVHQTWLTLSIAAYRLRYIEGEDFDSIEHLTAINPQWGGKTEPSDEMAILGHQTTQTHDFLKLWIVIPPFQDLVLEFVRQFPDGLRKIDILNHAVRSLTPDSSFIYITALFEEYQQAVAMSRRGWESWGMVENQIDASETPEKSQARYVSSQSDIHLFEQSHLAFELQARMGLAYASSTRPSRRELGLGLLANLPENGVLYGNRFDIPHEDTQYLGINQAEDFYPALHKGDLILRNLDTLAENSDERQGWIETANQLIENLVIFGNLELAQAQLSVCWGLIQESFLLGPELIHSQAEVLARLVKSIRFYFDDYLPDHQKEKLLTLLFEITTTFEALTIIEQDGDEGLKTFLKKYQDERKLRNFDQHYLVSATNLLKVLRRSSLRQTLHVTEKSILLLAETTLKHYFKMSKANLSYDPSKKTWLTLAQAIRALELSNPHLQEQLLSLIQRRP